MKLNLTCEVKYIKTSYFVIKSFFDQNQIGKFFHYMNIYSKWKYHSAKSKNIGNVWGKKSVALVIPDTESGKVEEMIIVLIKSQISDLTPKKILTIWEFYMNDVRSYYVEARI